MATKKSPKKRTAGPVLTAEEKAAMRELVKERKTNATKAEDAEAVIAKINEMRPSDRAIAKKVHTIVTKTAPELAPKLWYGMPAYFNEGGRPVCFFQDAAKFKYRYSTLGFQDSANLDEGDMWPTSYALTNLTAADEARIAALVKKAVR